MYQEVAGLVEVVQAFVTKYQFIIPLLPDTSPFWYSAEQIKILCCAK